jgi:hypothetical protein
MRQFRSIAAGQGCPGANARRAFTLNGVWFRFAVWSHGGDNPGEGSVKHVSNCYGVPNRQSKRRFACSGSPRYGRCIYASRAIIHYIGQTWHLCEFREALRCLIMRAR